MKTLRTTAERIFLGKNSSYLAERFQDHLLALAALLIITIAGHGLQKVIEHQTASDQTVSPIENWLVAAGDLVGNVAMVLGGYIVVLSLVLLIIGLFIKDTNEGDAPA